jgi:hypothetical protein
MKKLKLRRLKPAALPADPDIIDYVEFGFQWLASWLIIDIEGHPCIRGLLTGLLLIIPVFGIASVVFIFLSLTGHWKP